MYLDSIFTQDEMLQHSLFSEAILYGIKVFLLLSCDFLICVVLMKIFMVKKPTVILKEYLLTEYARHL